MRQRRLSVSPSRRATDSTGMCMISVMAKASNSNVKPELGRAPMMTGARRPDARRTHRTRCAARARREKPDAWREIEMPPRPLACVVDGATFGLALGAGEAAAGFEIELDIETLLGAIERRRCDEPRRRDAKGKLE